MPMADIPESRAARSRLAVVLSVPRVVASTALPLQPLQHHTRLSKPAEVRVRTTTKYRLRAVQAVHFLADEQAEG